MRRKQIVLLGMLGGLLALGGLAASPPVTTSTTAGDRRADSGDATSAATPAGVALPNYVVNWYSVNGGGTIDATSAHWKMGMSAAQSVAGEATSASYWMGVGFWYGACICPCHGDPVCDGVSNVQDVVKTVDVAFRGATPASDRLCPYEQTDVNCDGVSTVQDVVKMVNVAFRGADPAIEFCDPCAP
jgi:hypothetical protein